MFIFLIHSQNGIRKKIIFEFQLLMNLYLIVIKNKCNEKNQLKINSWKIYPVQKDTNTGMYYGIQICMMYYS